MDRTKLATPDEQVAEEFGRLVELLQKAKNKPAFTSRALEANERGLNWVEALEFVVDGTSCP